MKSLLMHINFIKGFPYKFNKNLGWLITVILVVIPLLIWVLMQPVSSRFGGLNSALTSFGQIFGLIGLVLFSEAMILSARTKLLGLLFGGMDRLYRIHHSVGIIAFVFILFHPIFLSVSYALTSARSAALFLLPGNDIAVDFGIYSLAVLITFLLITLYGKFRYEIMKFLHQILGIAFLLTAAHTVLILSDITQSVFLRSYTLALVLLGTLSFVYRTILSKYTVKYYEYVVTTVQSLPGKVVEIKMRPVGARMNYQPGQFIFIKFRSEYVSGEKHPFSISSSPSDSELSILVKALGDYTSNVQKIAGGTQARIEGPYGQFIYYKTFRPKNNKQIWIAGGVGLAPILGMARDLLSRKEAGNQYHIDLYYTARSKEEFAFFDELKGMSEKLANFRFIPFASEELGYLTAEAIEKKSGDIADKEIFICGPPPMMKGLKKQFEAFKIPMYSVHTEEFKLL
jgi:predicted ferric reductase